jgi:hypothetical protein
MSEWATGPPDVDSQLGSLWTITKPGWKTGPQSVGMHPAGLKGLPQLCPVPAAQSRMSLA